jgi:hypothetical protein
MLDFRKDQFLQSPTDDAVLRTTWDEQNRKFTVYCKRQNGRPEFEISDQTNLFVNASLQPIKITEQEYNDYK